MAINVPIVGDTIFEGPEAFTVTLSGSQDPIVKPTGTGTILDNDPPFQPPPGRTANPTAANQQLISRASDGGLPNGPVADPVISGDARIARYVAYSSSARNIAPGTDEHRNVFLLTRGGSPGASGTPWQYGSTALVSNNFGKKQPQGACPLDQGIITGLDLSARGNYSVFSCSGGAAYLYFIGGK